MASVLRGITKRDYRNAIAQLMDEGWRVERTSGGHLRLEHDDADQAVFASSSPSDVRAGLKVRTTCQNAIRGNLVRNGDGAAEHAELPAEDYRTIMKRRKQADKRARRRGSAAPIPVAPSPAVTRPVLPTRISELPSVMTDMTSLTTGTLPANVAKKPKISPRPTQKDQTAMPLDTTSSTAPDLTAAPVPPSIPAPAAATASAVPPTPLAIAPAKPAGVAPVLQDAVGVIPEDVLALAMRIAAGEMRQITITADMVGRTFFYDGTLVQVGDKVSAVSPVVAATGTAPTKGAVDTAVKNKPVVSEKQGIMLETLSSLGGFLSVTDLVALHADEMGYKNKQSAHASIGKMLALLERDGLIASKLDGKRRTFRKI